MGQDSENEHLRRTLRAGVLWGLVACITALAPAAASARWAKEHCSLVTHCYALTEWAMTGGSESVKGAEDLPTTNLISSPEYGESAFIDNEMWLSFPNKEGGWLETGQTSGWPDTNCCTLHPFIALSYRASLYGYEEYVWTGVHAEPTNLYSIQDPASNGNWCFYINSINQGCRTVKEFWSEYSPQLEAGIEASASNQPANQGSQRVNATSLSGTTIEWKGARTHSVFQTKNGVDESVKGSMCVGSNTESNFYGNAVWSIC